MITVHPPVKTSTGYTQEARRTMPDGTWLSGIMVTAETQAECMAEIVRYAEICGETIDGKEGAK